MKAVLALVSGFVVTIAVFASGAVMAAWFLAAEPVEGQMPSQSVAELWTREPTPVQAEAQDLERLPPRDAAPQRTAAAPEADTNLLAPTEAAAAEAPEGVDAATTASFEPDEAAEATVSEAIELPRAHVEWCASRYRSYEVRDNSYRPYSGGRRECMSPFMQVPAADEETVELDDGSVQLVADRQDGFVEEGFADEDYAEAELGPVPIGYAAEGVSARPVSAHVADCFARYRSYRPEDNTYQPFGGGPRLQCE